MRKLALVCISVFISSILFSQNVGIGSTTPVGKLEVIATSTTTNILIRNSATSTGIGLFNVTTSPSVGFNAWYNSGYKYVGDGYAGFFQYNPSTGDLNYYSATAAGTNNASIIATTGSFFTLDAAGRVGLSNSSPTAKLHVNGNMVIGGSGINPATGYLLSIDGKMVCEEARVQNSSAWPDYVFQKDYKLRPLEELEQLIRQQKHLPDIPSAAVVEKEGFDLGDMNKRLLQKIEELTLYVIELKKENKTMNERIEKLETKKN